MSSNKKKKNLFTCFVCWSAGIVTDLATAQNSLFVCERLALDKLVTSIVEPCRCGHTAWEACSHKQVINIFCMILAFGVIIYVVLKIFRQNLCLIEAILGYLVFPHEQRLKAVQVHFICYFAEGSHSSSGISLFHKGVSVKAVVGKFQGYWGTLPRQSKVKYVCVYHY